MVNLNSILELEIFANNVTTLRNTSLDKRSTDGMCYMVDSLKPVIDFDALKDEYTKTLCLPEIPKSSDALFFDASGNIILIEFKNGYIDPRRKFEIRKKIYDSVLILCDVANLSLKDLRSNAEYILVYSSEHNQGNPETNTKTMKSYNVFMKNLNKLAGTENILFGISGFEKYCFKKVHTMTVQEFEDYLQLQG